MAQNPIEQVIEARPRDVDGLAVERVLPSLPRQMVGPFIFLDHMGPAVRFPRVPGDEIEFVPLPERTRWRGDHGEGASK